MKNENIINEILEKIKEKGINSLTEEDRFILENKGELPKSLKNKKRLNNEKGYFQNGSVKFNYDKVYILDLKYDTNEFIKNISNFLDEMFCTIEITGILNIKNKSYSSNFYITIDKLNYNKDILEEEMYWDSELFINNKELIEYENNIEKILILILKKYLNKIFF